MPPRTLHNDINIFQNGWDDCNAYVFGWIMSDGCLLREGRNKTALAVRISLNDYDMAQWLHQYLCIGNKLYVSTHANRRNYMIKYRNKESIDYMQSYGLIERKSLTLSFPDIPPEVFWAFVRGYFDGNGSIILRTTQWNTYAQISITSGSPKFLEKLAQKLMTYQVATHLYADERLNHRAWYLRITKKSEIDRFCKLLYASNIQCPFLLRKKERADQILLIQPKYVVS